MIYRNQVSSVVNRLFGSNFNYTVFELSKYMSYLFLRNDMNIRDPDNKHFYSLGDITRHSDCDLESSQIYSYFWHAYLFQDGELQYNCSARNCDKINSKCFEMKKKDKTCSVISVPNAPCVNKEQSKLYNYHSCCEFVQSFTQNFEASLKLMKYSIQSTHFLETVEEESAVFANLTKAFQNTKFILKKSSDQTRRNFNNFIPLCQYAGYPEEMNFENCNLFQRSFSNLGLSFSFNTEKFDNIYHETMYNNIFKKVMNPNVNKNIIYPDSSGPDYRLRLLLNGKVLYIPHFN